MTQSSHAIELHRCQHHEARIMRIRGREIEKKPKKRGKKTRKIDPIPSKKPHTQVPAYPREIGTK
jgi:hypothetical protein